MFLLTEIKWQIFRNKGRAILLLLIAALLTGTMAFYVGNIQINEIALNTLGDNLPVKAQIVNLTGTVSSGLMIPAARFDTFTEEGIREVYCTAAGSGAFSPEVKAMPDFPEGDTVVLGANSLNATPLTESLLTFEEGTDSSFLAGDAPLCALDSDYARRNQISIGDEITLPINLYQSNVGYEKLAEDATFRVVATYAPPGKSDNAFSMLIPVQWMRNQAESLGNVTFCYDSCTAVLGDPLHGLNAFKERLAKKGFAMVDPNAPMGAYFGEAVVMQDETFIKTVGELEKNLMVYRSFLIPFFGVIVLLVTLSVFLILRSNRQNLAIAVSLGRSKLLSGVVSFAAVLLLSILGCWVAFLVMILGLGIAPIEGLLICGIFLACSCIGSLIALFFLLRFNPIELLTKTD